jgi:hypothetical protein
MSMTSHSKTLSLTNPHDIPGMSFADCISFSCRESRPAAPAEFIAMLIGIVDVVKKVDGSCYVEVENWSSCLCAFKSTSSRARPTNDRESEFEWGGVCL